MHDLHDLNDLNETNDSSRFSNSNISSGFTKFSIRDGFYAYSNSKDYILKNIKLTFNEGSSSAIIGLSGAGKSTLAKLLIEIFNKNDFNEFSVVEQNTFLFNDSITNNLTLFDDGFKLDELERVIEIVGLSEVISSKEDGLDFQIGENGMMISGGQRQRIAIARALLYNKPLLILDEAFAGLDIDSEIEILKNIRKAHPKMCLISITHRIYPDNHYDKIVLVKNGTII